MSGIVWRTVNSKKHLLVDGSNILHGWPELRVLRRRQPEAARARLSQALTILHDAEHLRVTLVFDGRGTELSVEPQGGRATFVHAFAPSGMTADDVIEQWVGQAREPADCIVATDDRAERQTIEALGATGMSAADLAQWIVRAMVRLDGRIAGHRKANDQAWRQPS